MKNILKNPHNPHGSTGIKKKKKLKALGKKTNF
jgi:hypothetical protein